MLKQIAHIILAIYLLIPTVGFSVTRHYCGDRLVSTSIDSDRVDECGCEMDHNAVYDECGMCQIKTEYVHLGSNFIVEHAQDYHLSPDFSTLLGFDLPAVFQEPIHNELPKTMGIIHIPQVGTRLAMIQTFLC